MYKDFHLAISVNSETVLLYRDELVQVNADIFL